MEKKAIALKNLGMNRDLSISKLGETNAYENYNIRILARDKDTLLSVTNERGNCEVPFSPTGENAILGDYLIGWNVLNEHLILFLTDAAGTNDYIYRVDFDSDKPKVVKLFQDNLGFDPEHPIESVVYYESEKVQKIYWLDGIHPLRMMNFMADTDEMGNWDPTYFDANRELNFGVSVEISKDNSGNARPNGVIQYLLTYFNKHGQETGYAWMSDMVYLSPMDRGGAADENNNNKVTLTFTGLDDRFTNYRVYSVFRSSYDGTAVAYIVGDGEVGNGSSVIVDDAANQTAVDASALLFLGSQSVNPGTMTHKDDTLFLGDLKYEGKNFDGMDELVQTYLRNGDGSCKSGIITFVYDEGEGFVENAGLYPYKNQLVSTSSSVTTFKGNEKYRFALSFRTKNGKQTESFWIGDATNYKYPIIDANNKTVKRVTVECKLPHEFVDAVRQAGYDVSIVQLMIAEASYADRSVKAQGVLNPTVFNVWDRYNDRVYALPSWATRPRNSTIANRHFQPVHNSIISSGEIDCNYWEEDLGAPKPYYRYVDYLTEDQTYEYDYPGRSKADYRMLIIGTRCSNHSWPSFRYAATAFYITASSDGDPDAATEMENFTFNDHKAIFLGGTYVGTHIRVKGVYAYSGVKESDADRARRKLYLDLKDKIKDLDAEDLFSNIDMATFDVMCGYSTHSYEYYNCKYPSNDESSAALAGDYIPEGGQAMDRWTASSVDIDTNTGGYTPAKYTQQYMFVDENIVTLNSPELFYEATSLDNVENYKLRIVGVAKISSCISDYTVDATHAMLPGQNLAEVGFSGALEDGYIGGLQSWPLWEERSLSLKEDDAPDVEDRSSEDYEKNGGPVRYWLRMWNKAGAIDGYADEDNYSYGILNHKVFANMKFAYETVYNGDRSKDWKRNISMRIFNSASSQILTLPVGDKNTYYDGVVDELLGCPGEFKYPIIYSYSAPQPMQEAASDAAYLYSGSPVPITYDSNPHLVFSLPTQVGPESSDPAAYDVYWQTVLPHLKNEPDVNIDRRDEAHAYSGALLPWYDCENYSSGTPGTKPIGTPNVLGGVPTVVSTTYELVQFEPYSNRATIVITKQNIQSTSIYNMLVTAGDFYGTSDFYISLVVSSTDYPEYNGKIFLVNASRFYLNDANTILIPFANIIAIEDVSSTSKKVNCDYSTYDSAQDEITNVGYKTLTVGTGNVDDITGYSYLDYLVDSTEFDIQPDTANGASAVKPNEEYVFIGEVYYPYGEDGIPDTRYGDAKNNKFIIAGPEKVFADLSDTSDTGNVIIGNQGDTYFQRWDDLRIKPHREDDANSVVDIVSVMLETHINIDGRTDNNRGSKYLASMNNAQFNALNKVYSQPNNFVASRDIDPDFNEEAYPSYITWTMQKAALAETDEWMHITLANTLGLDGDKGSCNALRKFNNTIFAFQDRCISEILFNSRTQLSTTSGVPVELANSGKVDGKRIVTNNYGCINKWSIVEGKRALYFIDNINKAFCSFDGTALDNISSRNGFDALFRNTNSVQKWNPHSWDNVVSYYDKENSDVYLMDEYETFSPNGETGCLVYSETLGRFSSFFGYVDVPMMTNVNSDFVAFRKNGSGVNKLWWQNKGAYCNFFGTQENFFVSYNVMPEPYGDKIWTNLEYRADFFNDLVQNGSAYTSQMHEQLIEGGEVYSPRIPSSYLESETFDTIYAWNEYQRTPNFTANASTKKFRIWRTVIPRAEKTETNKYSLDRIRNPWMRLFFGKSITGNQNKNLAQLHDVNVIYYE